MRTVANCVVAHVRCIASLAFVGFVSVNWQTKGSFLVFASTEMQGQTRISPYDVEWGGRGWFGYAASQPRSMGLLPRIDFLPRPEVPSAAGTIAQERLRPPLSPHVLKLRDKDPHVPAMGDHAAAKNLLRELSTAEESPLSP